MTFCALNVLLENRIDQEVEIIYFVKNNPSQYFWSLLRKPNLREPT